MAVGFTEIEKVADNLDIRQGDVLANLDEACDPWVRWAMVVTADCDLAQGKFGGIVSCVPIVRWQDYVARFVLVADVDALREKAVARLVQRVNKLRTGAGLTVPITKRGVELWLETAAHDRAAFDVEVHKDEAVRRLASFMRRNHNSSDFAELTELAVAGRISLGEAADASAATKSISNKFTDKFKKLPGDSIFFNSVVPGERGQLAYLRRIYALSDREISPRAWGVDGQVQFVRIGRMKSPFKQYAAQRLGAMFDSVGLPATYESAMGNLVSELTLVPGTAQ